MSLDIRIKKGLNIPLQGAAEKILDSQQLSETFAIKPADFKGIIPKIIAKPGTEVRAGSPLFYSKDDDRVIFTSPVSGELVDIVRGNKRKILEFKILADKEIRYEQFEAPDLAATSRDQVVDFLLKSGTWPFIRRRPYGTIARPDEKPKSIFISAIDTNPLGPDNDFVIKGSGQEFQKGLDVLAKLTNGKVHLNISGDSAGSGEYINSKNVQINRIRGPHPAGNVGVQIHYIDPINKGEVVWFLYPQDVRIIGKLFLDGIYDASRVVAITGSQVQRPRYYKTVLGNNVKGFLSENIKDGTNRVISGNALTGTTIAADNYLGFYDTQLTVLPEGNEPEFMGWMAPGFDKFSISRTFFSWLTPGKKYALNTNLHGEERAYVMTGQYEQVMPMDIYPVHLVKAIMIQDIELMENLGIYEVTEEDFALCEYVCTSKIDVQKIVSEGLELMAKECG